MPTQISIKRKTLPKHLLAETERITLRHRGSFKRSLTLKIILILWPHLCICAYLENSISNKQKSGKFSCKRKKRQKYKPINNSFLSRREERVNKQPTLLFFWYFRYNNRDLVFRTTLWKNDNTKTFKLLQDMWELSESCEKLCNHLDAQPKPSDCLPTDRYCSFL